MPPVNSYVMFHKIILLITLAVTNIYVSAETNSPFIGSWDSDHEATILHIENKYNLKLSEFSKELIFSEASNSRHLINIESVVIINKNLKDYKFEYTIINKNDRQLAIDVSERNYPENIVIYYYNNGKIYSDIFLSQCLNEIGCKPIRIFYNKEANGT